MNDLATRFATEIETILDYVEAALADDPGQAAASGLGTGIFDADATRFATLARMFALTRPEACLLLCLIAQYARPGLAAALRAKSGLDYVHEALVRDVFRLDLMPIYTSDSALNLWQLVRARDMGPGAPLAFDLDLAVIEWLAGKPGLEPALQQQLMRVEGDGDSGGVVAEAALAIRAAGARARGILCELTGRSATDHPQVAANIARALGTGLWVVQARSEPLEPDQVLRLHRFITVQNAALYWQAAEPQYLIPRISPSARLQFMANAEFEPTLTPATHIHLSFDVPAPPRDALRTALAARFPGAAASQLARTAAIRGVDARLIETAPAADIGAFAAHALARSTRALKTWAMPVPTDTDFDDLVVEDPVRDRLKALVAQIRTQHELMDSPEIARVYVQEKALTILLQGPPGTGKTLTARVLAAEAGLPLFRVDVASLVSKWRGETRKNLRALFRAATRSGALLFIDEFEAVVSRRTDARSEIARADNQNTAYFLQLIENAYEGTVVFATNRPKDIDEAMLRRIRHTIDVQPPGESARRHLWRLALKPFAPCDSVLGFADLLGPAFEMSGARIKAVVLNAWAQGADAPARKLTVDALRTATLDEARQNGRLPGPREMARVMAYGAEDREALT